MADEPQAVRHEDKDEVKEEEEERRPAVARPPSPPPVSREGKEKIEEEEEQQRPAVTRPPSPPPVRRAGKEVIEDEEEEPRLVFRSSSLPLLRRAGKDEDKDGTEDVFRSGSLSSTPSPPYTDDPEKHIFFRSPPPPRILHQAMDLFPDGGFLRLRSRATGKYLHADDDWVGVSLRRRRTLNTVWRVQHLVVAVGEGEERTFFLLQGAAYGRYLAVSTQQEEELPGPGLRVVQRDLDLHHVPGHLAFRWTVERVGADDDHVRVIAYDLNLRANGGYCSRNAGVTAESYEHDSRITSMKLWTVQPVPSGPVPPPLPTWQAMKDMFWRCCDLLFLQLAGRRERLLPLRRIYYVRADDDGNFNDDQNWLPFRFHDHSVLNLRTEMAHDLDDWNGDISAFTLCVRAGLGARLMPLVTDLPRTGDVFIVALRTGSPAAQALVYPQI